MTKTERPARQGRSRAAALLGPLAAVLAGGCEIPAEIAERESILAPLFVRPTEYDAVLWASDEYDGDKRARGIAMLAYGPTGGKPNYVQNLYLPGLAHADANVRVVAAHALGMHGTPDHVPAIVPLLKDESRRVRLSAAGALQRLHNPVAAAPLCDAARPARESDPGVRAEAADALGQYPLHTVLDCLITALDDPSLAVNQAALRSLRTLTGQSLGDDRREWARWVNNSPDPFAQRTPYVFPAYSRDKSLLEYIPFVPGPPNEVPAQPVGQPAVVGGKGSP